MSKQEEIRQKVERIRQWLFYNSNLNEKGNSKVRDYELDLLQAEAELKGIQEGKQELWDDLNRKVGLIDDTIDDNTAYQGKNVAYIFDKETLLSVVSPFIKEHNLK